MITSGKTVTTNQVALHYDELDPFYRQLWGEDLHHGLWRSGRESREQAARQLLRAVIEEACIGEGSRVCDVGCGYGTAARHLAREFGCRVTGYTVSPIQYARAIQQGTEHGEVRFLLQNWLDGTVPTEAYDALIAIESTEHMVDKEAIFRRAFKVLRPGGRIAVCAWISSPQPRHWEVDYLLRPICDEGRLAGLASKAEYVTWIQGAGFTRLRAIDLSYQVRRTWTICTGRLALSLVRPAVWQALLNRRLRNRRFALAVLRIWVAYRTGAMRYALFSATRGSPEQRLGGAF